MTQEGQSARKKEKVAGESHWCFVCRKATTHDFVFAGEMEYSEANKRMQPIASGKCRKCGNVRSWAYWQEGRFKTVPPKPPFKVVPFDEVPLEARYSPMQIARLRKIEGALREKFAEEDKFRQENR